MMTFPIPVVALGPGSQPLDDESFAMLDVPTDMPTFRPPVVELEAAPEVIAAALSFLRELLADMKAAPYGSRPPVRRSLDTLPAAIAHEVDDMLGEGEVSVLTGTGLRAQETAFPSIWRIRGDGIDEIEAGAFPSRLKALVAAHQAPEWQLRAPPAGLMNAPALLNEIADTSARRQEGMPPHVINLSLLPVTPEDLAWLDESLGRAGVSVLSRGFGNCRVTATQLPGVWWVQYFNNMEKLILNSIEIAELPEVVLAAREDYEDSCGRLAEWIASIESAK